MTDGSYHLRVPKKWARTALIVGLTALIVAPLTAVAAHTFNDVPDSHTFHNDITWLADVGVTQGCNPPDNTEFCPDDNVTRGQMAAFMKRFAGYIDAEDGTPAEADHAATAGNAQTAQSAQTAQNANNLGGEPADSYARPITSEWVFAESADDLFFDGTNFTHKIVPAPEITQDVLDRGTVLVYMRFLSGTYLLPYTSHAGSEPNTLDYFLEPGEIHITRFSDDNSPVAIGGVLRYRYVIIPNAEVLAAAGGSASSEDLPETTD